MKLISKTACFRILAALCFLSFAALPVSAETKGPITTPLDSFELGKYQYCGSDQDCVPVNNGCCDCANGGEDVAVNKERLEAFRARFDCLHVACTERASIPPCGTGVVSCISHRCHYHKREDVKFGN